MVKVEKTLELSYPDVPEVSLKPMVHILSSLRNPGQSVPSNQLIMEKLGQVTSKIVRISLYQSLFPGKLGECLVALGNGDILPIDMIEQLDGALPEEVRRNSECMEWLSMCTRRISQMYTPRYGKLQDQLNAFMRLFIARDLHELVNHTVESIGCLDNDTTTKDTLPTQRDTVVVCDDDEVNKKVSGSLDSEQSIDDHDSSIVDASDTKESQQTDGLSEETNRGDAARLNMRYKLLQDHIDALPWNVSKQESLVRDHGYDASFWCRDNHELDVTTDGSLDLEENLRQSLLSCYAGYVEIMNRLSIPSVQVDGAVVEKSELFGDELTLLDLKGRRSIAIKVKINVYLHY